MTQQPSEPNGALKGCSWAGPTRNRLRSRTTLHWARSDRVNGIKYEAPPGAGRFCSNTIYLG